MHLRAIMFLTLSPPLPPLMDFPAGYFALGGGGGGVWQVGQAQGRKWWFNFQQTTRGRGVFLVLVQNVAARGLVQKPSNYSLSSVRYIEKNTKNTKNLYI